MLPVSQEMLEIVRSFIDHTYSALCSTNDLPFRANAVEVYPKSEGGYSVLLYKTQPPVGGDLDKVFEYNTDPTSNKAYMDFCKGLEKYINGLDEYKYFKFQVIPGRKLTKQVVNFIIYPEHKFDKPTPEDLEKFDIKELTRDSRLKQNESADPVESDRIKESFDPAEEAFLNGTSYCPDCYDEDEDIDGEGYDAGGHYVGAEDNAFVADFLRDQAKDDLLTESTLKEDAKDAAWGEGYKAVKQDEYESMRTPNPYEPGSDFYRYWQNGYKAGEEDLQGGYYNESKEAAFEAVLKETADLSDEIVRRAYKQGYHDAYHDENISVRLRTPNPYNDLGSRAAWNSGYKKGMEDLEAGVYKLTECDGGCCGEDCGGAVTASDFSGQVPENMGAVVGPGKNDKKFSDVFGD